MCYFWPPSPNSSTHHFRLASFLGLLYNLTTCELEIIISTYYLHLNLRLLFPWSPDGENQVWSGWLACKTVRWGCPDKQERLSPKIRFGCQDWWYHKNTKKVWKALLFIQRGFLKRAGQASQAVLKMAWVRAGKRDQLGVLMAVGDGFGHAGLDDLIFLWVPKKGALGLS